ncbi:hypothetical protein [Sphingosinicella sp. BN140058]|uniref:hypothetical protein n=1 Tax=Sphingosinicella sp. BN140058 TaxID=1892855 RepID=UPI001010679B|nr:hypothetical protein [Sphingosinicella sp. BN140058]QAY80241.1 hypothetical protein ETR14_26725 [Sphingosinicella sp. BN140058]
MTVAKTILAQLGGNRFVQMTSAKDFSGGPDCLMFRLPAASTKHRANAMRIYLDPTDSYRLELVKVTRAKGPEVVDKREMIYAEQLQSIFTDMTGLYTRL